MTRFAVIGVSGYLGGRIAQYLKQQGHEVIGVYRTFPDDSNGVLDTLDKTLTGDLTDPDFIKQVSECHAEVIIYTISLNHHESEKDYRTSVKINMGLLMELGRQLAEQPNFKRLIYFSTMQVYGQISPEQVISESTPVKPINMYGLTHALCEQGLDFLFRTSTLDSVSLRLSNGYGAPAFSSCDCWWLVINDFCRLAFSEGKIQLKSDGTPQRDFIHVKDIARAVELLAETKQELPLAFNLASGDTLTMLELAHVTSMVFEEKFNRPLPVLLPNGRKSEKSISPVEKMRIKTSVLSSLGFKTSIKLEQGIGEVLESLAR